MPPESGSSKASSGVSQKFTLTGNGHLHQACGQRRNDGKQDQDPPVEGSEVALLPAVGVAGLLPYVYLPLRSRMDPRLDWGDPETLERFLDVVLRRDFWHRAWMESAADWLPIAGDYLRSLGDELLWAGAALAADSGRRAGDWLQQNSAATAALLAAYPGLAGRYRRLVAAHLPQRPQPDALRRDAAAQERLIRQCLLEPHLRVSALPPARRAPQPVPLWLHPEPPQLAAAAAPRSEEDDEQQGDSPRSEEIAAEKRRSGERVDMPDGRDGLLAFRLESLFTRAEYVSVDRSTEENQDSDAKSALEDLDVLSLARDRRRSAARLRFDLDLPPECNDDLYLGEGIPLPEWDFRQQAMQPDYCRLQPMLAHDAVPAVLPDHLRVTVGLPEANQAFIDALTDLVA